MENRHSGPDPSAFDVGGDRQDELFDVLSHPARRFTLRYLQTADVPLEVSELATELVAWEVERPVSDRTSEDRDAIEVSLLHSHLPKMAAAGLVRYDTARKTVSLADRTDEVQAHLQTMASD